MSETMVAEALVSDDVLSADDVLDVTCGVQMDETVLDAPSELGGVSDVSSFAEFADGDPYTAAIDEIIKVAERAFNSGTRDRLITGEKCYNLLLKERDRRGEKFKRDECIKRMHDCIFDRSRLAKSTIEVSTWIKVTQIAYKYFGVSQVSKMPTEAINALSWNLLRAVEKLVDRDKDENYAIRKGCVDLFRSILDSHVKCESDRRFGAALREQIDDHIADLKRAEEGRKRASKTPEQIANEAAKELDVKRQKLFRERTGAAAKLRDTLAEQEIHDDDDKLKLLEEMNVFAKGALVPKDRVQTNPARVDLDAFARLMTKEDGLSLVRALNNNGRADVIDVMLAQMAALVRAAKALRDRSEEASIPMARAV